MELLRQVTNVQFLYPVAAVAVVLICAALVFVFGFHSAEQPQFDKLPLIVDDKKSSAKKKKTKDKKSSPNRNATEDVKTKSDPKKSPAKEKKEEKPKEPERHVVEKKEKVVEPKVKKEIVVDNKKGRKNKVADVQKPEDFDDGLWEEVPKKSEKKKPKVPEEKKESPVKKIKKKNKDADVEAAQNVEREEPVEVECVKVVSTGPTLDEEAARALQAQVEEFQRAMKAVELRDKGLLVEDEAAAEELPEVKDLRSDKKIENKEKQVKKKANEAAKNASKTEVLENSINCEESENQDQQNAPVFDELGDTWTEAKAPKKSKKKARKE